MTALRPFGNAVLAFFLADALLTVADGLLSGLLGVGVLGTVQGLLALTVVVLSVFTAPVLALSRRLPLSVFVPPLLFVLWVTLLAMPLPLWVAAGRLQLVTGLLQCGVAAAMLGRLYHLEGRPWLVEGGVSDQAASLSWPGRLGRAAALLLLAPLGVVLYSMVSASYAVSHSTDGFLGLGLRGVWVAHRTYAVEASDAQKVHLIAMIHIGEPDAYDQLFDDIPANRQTLVLLEGVTDLGDLAGAVEGAEGAAPELSYQKVAERLNLAQQGAIEELTDAPVRHADVDMAAFSPQTRRTIAQLGKLFDADDWPTFLTVYEEFSQEVAADPDLAESLFADILDLRNDHLIGVMDEALAEREVVVIPWGAYHLPEIARAVEARGFSLIAEERVTLIRYAALF